MNHQIRTSVFCAMCFSCLPLLKKNNGKLKELQSKNEKRIEKINREKARQDGERVEIETKSHFDFQIAIEKKLGEKVFYANFENL